MCLSGCLERLTFEPLLYLLQASALVTELLIYPHCDLHLSLNNAGPLPFRVFTQTLSADGVNHDLVDVTANSDFQLFAPYNVPGDATHDRLEEFVTIDPAAATITPDAVGINLMIVQRGPRYKLVRIQVHDDILGWWFGNSSITTALHASVAHSQPSIYARFSDDSTRTDLVGDITGHGYVNLTSSSESIFTVSNETISTNTQTNTQTTVVTNQGRLLGVSEGPATLNGSFLGISDSLDVKVEDYAKPRNNMTVVRATDIDKFTEKHNILFLAEGYRSSEEGRFIQEVEDTVDELFSKPRHEPFNLLEGSFNVFRSFQASNHNAVTCGFRVNDEETFKLKKGRAIPYSRSITINSIKYTLEELVARVGLPLRNETRSTSELKTLWASQSLNNYDSSLVTSGLINAWKKSTSLGILEARDTYHGLHLGARWADRSRGAGSALTMPTSDAVSDANLPPLIARTYEWFNPRGTNRSLTPDPRRHPPELFQSNTESVGHSIMRYINGLHLAGHANQHIGPEWVPDGSFKKSRGLIVMLVNDGLLGGTNINDGTITANTLGVGVTAGFEYPNTNTAIKTVMRRTPPNELPMDIDRIVNVVAHEFGHSFNLGDEYEEQRGDAPDAYDEFDNIANFNHIALGATPNTTTRHIDIEKVGWRDIWRIEKSSKIIKASETSNGKLKVSIDPRQISSWSAAKEQNKEVYVRHPVDSVIQLPQPSDDAHFLIGLTIGTIDENNGTILLGGPELPPLPLPVFPKGSVIFIPKRDEEGKQVFAMEKKVRESLVTTRLPMNKDTDRAKVKSGPDHPDSISDFKPPCDSAKLIGVYEGAFAGTGMVYRPAGTCKMRTSGGIDENGEYCFVCKWLIVNRVDPSWHDHLDRLFYPTAKKND